MDEQEVGVTSTTALRRLLTRLRDNPQANVCLRTRCLGEMWQPNFMRVLMVTEKGLVLHDEVTSKAVIIPFVRDIVQFEIDKPFEEYQPHFHYTVKVE